MIRRSPAVLFCLLRKTLEFAENHFTGRCLKRACYTDNQLPPYLVVGALDHHHRPVRQIADSLVRLFAGLDNLDLHRLPRQRYDLQRIRKVVDIQYVNLSHTRDLAEVIVRRRQPTVAALRKHH